jgi:hypothetical protein
VQCGRTCNLTGVQSGRLDCIRVNPHLTRSVDVASMLLDATFEAVGLPSLNMDLGGEELAWYTLNAVDGDLELLLGKVLERLVLTLRRKPPVSWT